MSTIKTVLIGDSGVGKTSIFQRFESDIFKDEQNSTVGGAYTKLILQNDKGASFDVGLWDTAGQERFRNIIPMYFQGATFVLLVYDITNRDSFNGLSKWVETIREKGPDTAQLMIVGNKCDMEKERAIPMSEGTKFANDVKAVFYSEISAKTKTGIDILQKELTDRCEVLMSISNDIRNAQTPNINNGSEILRKKDCKC